MIVYLTSWYEEKNPARRQELITCLTRTLNSEDVDAVYLLAESEPPAEIAGHEKLNYLNVESRPTYSDFFRMANQLCADDDYVAVIANTDLYPAPGSREHLESIKQNECYALSRWDEAADGSITHFSRKDSQDVWVFRYPLRPVKGDFCTGIPGCDNRIAHEIKEAGYTVLNPSKTIVFHHLHNSGVRNYTAGKDAVPPPYHRVEPTQLTIPKMTTCSTEKVTGVLHVGFSQPPLERAFAANFPDYKFIRWTDYQKDIQGLHQEVLKHYLTGRYQLMFFHVQTPNVITPALLQAMQEAEILQNPLFVNWTGDVRHPLPLWYTNLGKYMTMTLFSNETDMKTAREKGIEAHYLNIGFDDQIFRPGPHPGLPTASVGQWPEIVFMGNNYPGHFPLSQYREEMVNKLQARYGKMFGLYGGGWGKRATGNLMNNEQAEADCYRGCKIAINLSHYDYERYSSDRNLRIMGSGAFCLSHRYKGIERDFTPGTHLAVWDSIDDLCDQIDHYLSSDTSRMSMAEAGSKLAHTSHTWNNRIQGLKQLLKI